MTTHPIAYRTVQVRGLDIFYREAGAATAPVLLLLHGFPSSSAMFRDLIPRLASHYRVIAPDYPGFGYSTFPSRDRFAYTFDHLAEVVADFSDALKLTRYALYVQDYGAPIGFRLAVQRPERVTALVIQNGNAYLEGLSDGWAPMRAYWESPTQANRDALRMWLSAEGIRTQYLATVPDAIAARVSPDSWTLDHAHLSRAGSDEAQLDLFGDYQHNLERYPAFQAYFRSHQPPTLIAWGKYDPFFTVPGAKAYLRDLPKARLELLEAGHFALETEAERIAELIIEHVPR